MKTVLSALAVVLLLGAYAVADANDIVPGVLTTAPPYPEPAPFPTAPGAIPAPGPSALFAQLPEDGPIPAASVSQLVAELVADTRLGPHVGALVIDAATGQTLGAFNDTQPFTPASTQKLLTAAAVAVTLDPNATLDTRVYLDGDRLILDGSGDMLLAAGAGDPALVNGRAGLADLAAQVAAALRVTGTLSVRLTFDDTLFSGPTIAPAVPEIEARSGFVAPVASMAVNEAMLGENTAQPREPDPALATAKAFTTALLDEGISVTGTPERTVADPSYRLVGTVKSATIREITGWAMQTSDNTITEVLARLVALATGRPGSNDGAVQAVIAAVQQLGVDMSGAVLVDASGLGRGSQISPRQIAAVLALGADPTRPALREIVTDMAIGGLNGTLDIRFTGDAPARGLVRGKTGSLPNVRSLAGTVITSGSRMLIFVLSADQLETGGEVGASQIYDAFVNNLASLDS